LVVLQDTPSGEVIIDASYMMSNIEDHDQKVVVPDGVRPVVFHDGTDWVAYALYVHVHDEHEDPDDARWENAHKYYNTAAWRDFVTRRTEWHNLANGYDPEEANGHARVAAAFCASDCDSPDSQEY